MITRLFLAGAISGRPDGNFAAFKRARNDLEDRGYVVTTPYDFTDPHDSWLGILGKCFQRMEGHDGIAILPDSLRSKGTQLQIQAAKRMCMEVRTVRGWIERTL